MELLNSSSLRICGLAITSYFAVALLILIGCTKPVSPPIHSWPDAKWRPYADSSPFNFVIPPNAPDLIVNPGSNSSSVIVNQILGSLAHCDPNVSATYSNCKPTNWVASQDHMSGGGWPTYQPIATDPLINIVCKGGPCPFNGHKVQVRMPAGAHVQVGSPDRHLTIIDRDGVAQRDGHAAPKNIEYDFYQVQEDSIPPMDGGTIHVTAEGSLRLDGNGVTDVGGDLGGNTTASDFGNLAGRVRVEELNAGHINHAITITVSCNNGSVAYPARATGGSSSTCPTTGAGPVPGPAMGQLLQLKMSPDAINAASSNPWVRTVLTAMATYGMYVNDNGGVNQNSYFAMQSEGAVQYWSLHAGDPWLDFAKTNNWWIGQGNDLIGSIQGKNQDQATINFWRSNVWNNLRVVDPCILPGSPTVCPSTRS